MPLFVVPFFAILIVIIVAMFIEWVISGNRANEAPKAIYSAPFVTETGAAAGSMTIALRKLSACGAGSKVASDS